MNQQQIQLAEKTYSKAEGIAVSRRIHKSSCGNMWMVELSNGHGFYKIEYTPEGEFMCECKAFEYGLNPCKHIYAIALKAKEVKQN